MSYERNSLPEEISVEVPVSVQETFQRVSKSKDLTHGTTAAIMIAFCCRLLEELPMNKADSLSIELDFARSIRTQNQKRADQLLGVAEKVLLESQGIQRGVRNRAFAVTKEEGSR